MNASSVIVFDVFLILYSSYSLSRRKKSLNAAEKIKLLVEVIGIIIGISLITFSEIAIVWRVVIDLIIVVAGVIIIFWDRLKEIRVRSPFVKTQNRYHMNVKLKFTRRPNFNESTPYYHKLKMKSTSWG